MTRRLWTTASLFWMLIATAWMAMVFSLLPFPALQTDQSRSEDAAIRLFVEHNIPVGHAYRDYIGPPPELPILDQSSHVHTSSCNPHVDLTELSLSPGKFREIIPLLRDLIPSSGSSHVAIYVNSVTTGREKIMIEADRTLPHCVIFDESQHFLHRPLPGG
ncbi:hypothetical protein [Rhodopirellula sp. SWK7]|uniref:hypothetical protein n=1 Tax=Rhodopirellula sp. SWK7 TaxID=595460 RepID=UPI0005C5E68F|nr:hypothetical protein [Rhodopirellula sp. SWK7]